MDAAQAATEDGEVLTEHVDQTAVDRPPPSHHAVAQDLLLIHSEVGLAMHHEGIDLPERTLVKQDLDPFASR